MSLLKNLWKVIYEDGKLNQNEDHLIKIIVATVNLDHKDIVTSKLEVKEESGF